MRKTEFPKIYRKEKELVVQHVSNENRLYVNKVFNRWFINSDFACYISLVFRNSFRMISIQDFTNW